LLDEEVANKLHGPIKNPLSWTSLGWFFGFLVMMA
jgi:hypothetical protein